MKRDCYERLRQLYKPDRIRVLLVGESRPSSGRFFYFGEGPLFEATRDALKVFGAPRAPVRFLSWFWCQGFYLHDLCTEPVDGSASDEWARLAHEGERRLASLFGNKRIPLCISSPKQVSVFVEAAILKSKSSPNWTALPFPTRRKEYIWRYRQGVRAALRDSGWKPLRNC
jgi:hypothetical protein